MKLKPCAGLFVLLSDQEMNYICLPNQPNCTCCHLWPCLHSGCGICLEQFAGDCSCIGIVVSLPQ